MNNSPLQDSITKVNLTFSQDTLEVKVCGYVFSLLLKLGGQFDSVSLGSVLHALKWQPDFTHKRAIATALDFLTQSDTAIFERRYELWDDSDEDVLDMPICEFSQEDIRLALEVNELICPKTGEIIPNFLDRVTVLYVVTDAAKRSGQQGSGS